MLLIPKTPEVFSPETVRPYPKAAPRKINSAGRRKRKSAILTDTPKKNYIKTATNLKKLRNKKKLSACQSFADCGNKETLRSKLKKVKKQTNKKNQT